MRGRKTTGKKQQNQSNLYQNWNQTECKKLNADGFLNVWKLKSLDGQESNRKEVYILRLL